MPELPEVETIVQGLRKRIRGKTISKTRGLGFKPSLVGKRILRIRRRGKYVVLSLHDGSTLLIHLGMTGRLLYSQVAQKPSKYTRASFTFTDGSSLRFDDVRRFGRMMFYPNGEKPAQMEKLGVEPLAKDFTRRTLETILRRSRRRVKELLMDQRVIAGIGNIYAQEILFVSKVNPFAPSCSLSAGAIRSLHGSIKETLQRAIAERGTTFSDYLDVDGKGGNFQDCLQVYHRERCPRCKGKIERVKLSGRTTYYCPRCQRA